MDSDFSARKKDLVIQASLLCVFKMGLGVCSAKKMQWGGIVLTHNIAEWNGDSLFVCVDCNIQYIEK